MNDNISPKEEHDGHGDASTQDVADNVVVAALRRLNAAGIEPIIQRHDCLVALGLSAPTVSRMQRRRELPPFDEISPGRKGWRRETLVAVLDGRRNWPSEL